MIGKEDIAAITKGLSRIYLKKNISTCRVVRSKTRKTAKSSMRLGEEAKFSNFIVECFDSRGKKCVRAEVDKGTINGEPFLEISFGRDRERTVQVERT